MAIKNGSISIFTHRVYKTKIGCDEPKSREHCKCTVYQSLLKTGIAFATYKSNKPVTKLIQDRKCCRI